MDLETKKMLITKALSALENAYAPYSKYRVGAALLSEDGDVFIGCNVENASYGLTTCAERNAFSTAIQSGSRCFVAIAVTTDGDKTPYPCGACRQVMAEFCGDEFSILAARTENPDNFEEFQLVELLPKRFDKNNN